MMAAWHIAKKDLRRFRWPVGLLVLLIALEFGVGLVLLFSHRSEDAWFNMFATAGRLFWGMQLAFIYILAGAVVHEDGPIASTSFWSSRPVSAVQLLSGKLLGLFIMVVAIPWSVHLPWWVWAGLLPSEALRAAMEILIVNFGVVLVAMPLAALTKSMSEFLLGWTLVGACAVITLALTLRGPLHLGAFSMQDPASAGAVGAAIVVGTLGSLAALYYFYWRRRFPLAVVTFGLVFVGVLVAFVEGRRLGPAVLSSVMSRSPNVSQKIVTEYFGSFGSSSGEAPAVFKIGIRAAEVPDDYILQEVFSQNRLRWNRLLLEQEGWSQRFDLTWVAILRALRLEADPDSPGVLGSGSNRWARAAAQWQSYGHFSQYIQAYGCPVRRGPKAFSHDDLSYSGDIVFRLFATEVLSRVPSQLTGVAVGRRVYFQFLGPLQPPRVGSSPAHHLLSVKSRLPGSWVFADNGHANLWGSLPEIELVDLSAAGKALGVQSFFPGSTTVIGGVAISLSTVAECDGTAAVVIAELVPTETFSRSVQQDHLELRDEWHL